MELINENKPDKTPVKIIRYCDTFFKKGRGLMFAKTLGTDKAIILAEKQESRINTAIHMLFMNFDITVLWLDKKLEVVDKVLAKKWKPFYMSKKPAQFVVELHQSQYDNYAVGDKLIFEK